MFDRNDSVGAPRDRAGPAQVEGPADRSAPAICRIGPDLRTYLWSILATPSLTREEEHDLGWRIINDDCHASREQMVRANLRLVTAIAVNYSDRGLTLADTIEAGNTGLLRAVEGFDPAQGVRFSTYASWWIKQAIRRAIVAGRATAAVPQMAGTSSAPLRW